MDNKRKKVLLISLDALSSTDFDAVSRLTHFKELIAKGAYCREELSVFPSLTFPCHASISTGCVPGHHGIVSNYLMEPYSQMHHWNFYVSNMKCSALWDYARRGGKRVLSMSWPVSAGADIDYSMPEMTPAKPKVWSAANFFRQLNVFRRYGTPRFAVKTLLSRPGLPKAWFFGTQPKLDREMIEAFCTALPKYDFDIAMLHIYGMDDAKHVYGVDSVQAKEYLTLYDSFVGRLIDYINSRVHEDITLIITGDHSQKAVAKAVYGNHLLEQLGLCSFEDGKLSGYRAYMHSGDGMAYIYYNEGEENPKTTEQIIERFANNPGVAKVLTPKEFIPLGCDRTAALVVEAVQGYGFNGGFCKDVMDENCIGATPDRGLHGYLPDAPDYQTMLFFYGGSVKPQQIGNACITDITPTICDWLGLPADPMDGKPLRHVFKGGDGAV